MSKKYDATLGLCPTCQVSEHDVCANDPDCTCCRDTLEQTLAEV